MVMEATKVMGILVDVTLETAATMVKTVTMVAKTERWSMEAEME
jgi:hypothetical protein